MYFFLLLLLTMKQDHLHLSFNSFTRAMHHAIMKARVRKARAPRSSEY